MHIPRGRRHCFEKTLIYFMLVFSLLYDALICFVALIASCLCVGHVFILMLLCFIGCMFGCSLSLLYDHCSHFHMTILVFDQVAHMFHILITWSQFTCYIILVLLSLDLPWESNVFCASVSGYKYICSKFITVPMIHDRGSDMIGKYFIFCTHVAYVSFKGLFHA